MLTYSRLEFSRKKADDVSLSPFKEMHCRKNSNLPSSSSSSPKSGSASPVSPSKQKQRPTRDLGFLWSRRDQAFQPRLTRQRKLRHLSDVEVEGLASNNRHSTRTAFSANSTPFSCSPNSRGRSSVAPLPLPLPDLPALLRRRPDISASSSGRFPLPSPKEVQSTSRDEDDRAENLNGMFSTSSPGSMLSYHFGCKGPEKSRKVPTRSANSLDTIVLQDSDNAENSKTLRLSVPAKSAPNSGRSSPVRSPRRLSTGDQLASLYAHSPELQFWFAPEFPPSDMMISGFPSRTSPEKICGQSPEWSPLQSPAQKSPAIKSSNPSGTATSLHSKISSEKSPLWHDNGLVTVHPLPLPPAVANPSHMPLGHQSPVKSEVSSMASQWKKGKLIGSGTFGHVYVATNRETGALCAMKEVNLIPDDPKSTECMMQLEQEIKVLSQLKHPNIVQYYGSEIAEDRFYIYLEFVHPGSISKYVREHCGAMTESVVRNFTRHILSGLAYLHSTNTIHRDIKGANLLVDAFGVVKLADFGMAKHLSGQAAALSLKGSPYWMAPEVMQAMMQKDGGYDLAVDIWSLGCTIVEMFTGKPPWSGFEGAAAMFKVLKNECPPIPETLSAEGKDFLQCCFQRNPADRPSASALLEHRFVKNSSHSHEIPGCIQAISQMKLTDVTQSPRDRSNLIQTRRRRPLSNGETSQSHPETSKSAAGPRHSPRSTLEAIHSIYSPPSSHLSGPSSNIINKFCSSPGGGNSRFYSLAGFHGRELLHPS